jgi:hypothetical protein
VALKDRVLSVVPGAPVILCLQLLNDRPTLRKFRRSNDSSHRMKVSGSQLAMASEPNGQGQARATIKLK